MSGRHRAALVLSNGHAGAEKQALALASRLQMPVAMTRCLPPPALARLPTPMLNALTRRSRSAQSLLQPFTHSKLPDVSVAISCGRNSIPASVALRARHAAKKAAILTVHIQRPSCAESEFDLVVAPLHDYSAADTVPSNVLLTDGALHDVSSASLCGARTEWAELIEPLPAPRFVLLLGGAVTRRWWQRPLAPDLTPSAARELVRTAAAAVGARGGSLLLTTSRRTSDGVSDAVRAEVACAIESGLLPAARIWTPHEVNPYAGLLAWADYLLVTADSVSMTSEACGTAKPVYVWGADRCQRRFRAFHEHMLKIGHTRQWTGDLEDPGRWQNSASRSAAVSDNELAAERVRQMLESRGLTAIV